MQSREYDVDSDGNFRFTEVGIKEQAPLLAKAGINARSIKTYAEYIQAREAARPYFLEYLQEGISKRLEGKPNTIEWQAVRSLVFGSVKEQEKLIAKWKTKKSFRIV